MKAEGPLLETLTRRLSECPGDFLTDPLIGGEGTVHVAAVVSDLVADMGGQRLSTEAARGLWPDRPPPSSSLLKATLVASWLLHDPWFLERREFAPRIYLLLASEPFRALAGVVPATDFVNDPDRREELVRLCLSFLDLRPAGESKTDAEDRLTALDSVERTRVVREAREAEERARKIREAAAKKKAEEAAASYGRE
jgi:hypothetical protein